MNETDLSKLLDEALDDLLTGEKEQKTKINNNPEKSKNEKQTKTTTKTSQLSTPSSKLSDEDIMQESLKKISEIQGLDEEMNTFFEELNAKFRNGELPELNQEEAKARIDESVPQIFGMMQNLLSKELLMPALTELLPKFNAWLEKNSASLSKSERKRYQKQCSLIKQMIDVFDDKSLNDQEKFELNIGLMETMQSLGSPPDELVVPAGNMGQCSIM